MEGFVMSLNRAYFGFGVVVHSKDRDDVSTSIEDIYYEPVAGEFEDFAIGHHGMQGEDDYTAIVFVRKGVVHCKHDENMQFPKIEPDGIKYEWKVRLRDLFTKNGWEFSEPKYTLALEFVDI